MFIDVTRWGGMRIMRLAVAAIAYIDAVDGGAAVHLIGGESLRVNEDPSEIEARAVAVAAPSEPAVAPAAPAPLADLEISAAPLASLPPPPPPPPAAISPSLARDLSHFPAKRGRRNGR